MDITEQENAHEATALTPRQLSRRAFAKTSAAAGVGVIGASLLGGRVVSAQGLTDADILNFALNLEYLEAEFYTKATSGKTIADFGLDVSGTGESGPTTGHRG
jgi:hypothetical protein